MDNRQTLRLWDGMTHYDFPCYKSDEDDYLYHSLINNYPLRAVRKSSTEKSSDYEALRSVSETTINCCLVTMINWINNWQLQVFYENADGTTNLCITGYDIDMISPQEEDDSLTITFGSSEKQVVANFNQMTFEVQNHSDEYYDIYGKSDLLTRYYNEDSQVLLIGFNDRLTFSSDA